MPIHYQGNGKLSILIPELMFRFGGSWHRLAAVPRHLSHSGNVYE
jgi:hypothetical protein